MKIQFTLHDEATTDAGGMGVTAGLAKVYREAGNEVDILCFGDLPSRMPVRAKALAFPALVAARLARSPADVIDASSGDACLLGKLPGVAGAPPPLLVCRSHGLAYTSDRAYKAEERRGNVDLSWRYRLYWSRLRLREERAAMRSADLCLFLNPAEQEIAVERFGVAEARARIVDNGIADFLVDREPTAIASLVEDLKIAYIGSYIPHKGVRYLVEALEEVFAAHPAASATLLGTGTGSEEVLADFDPRFHDRVHVVPEYRHRELPELLAGHAIALSASLREGFPLGILEAMACGLVPVIADIPGPTSYVENERNGLLVPPSNGHALAAAVQRLVADPALYERLRDGAHATAQDYSWTRIGEETLALYREAAAMRQPL